MKLHTERQLRRNGLQILELLLHPRCDPYDNKYDIIKAQREMHNILTCAIRIKQMSILVIIFNVPRQGAPLFSSLTIFRLLFCSILNIVISN
jgi:hypothetical protein